MVNLFIDGMPVSAQEGTSVLLAAQKLGIRIPTLCYLKDLQAIGACRVCVVEVEGNRNLQASCVMPVAEGMKVHTHTPKVLDARRTVLELILSDHQRDCLTCVRNNHCELQALCADMGIDDVPYEPREKTMEIDDLGPSIVRDNNKCILCRRCITACKNQNVHAIGLQNRGFKTVVGSVFEKPLSEVPCVNCGQCISVCPVGALTEKDNTAAVWEALADPNKKVVFQPAPAVRIALGDYFGMPLGTRVTGKMAAAMRRLGAFRVFDTDFGADLTIMEEGTELIERIQNGGVLPMITSCSPGWVKFCEHFYPDMLPNLSSCKSPHQMVGAVVKTWFAQREKIDPKELFVVSVMPCTAKKFEAARPEMGRDGYQDVDAVITTRELSRMIKKAGLDFINLPDEDFDPMLGESTGAAVIFGATGGVMEAALRTVAEVLTGKQLDKIEFESVRGVDGVKIAEVPIGDLNVRVAVAHGLGNASKLLDMVKTGEKKLHFIEVMACPGGCVTGGGQPIVEDKVRNVVDPRAVRASAIYAEDKELPLRKSHENPSIKKIYDEFLEKPGSHKSHELLHTHYTPRERF